MLKIFSNLLLNRRAPSPTTSQRPLDGLRARLRAQGYGEDDISGIFLESAYHNDARRRDGRPRPFEHDLREILRQLRAGSRVGSEPARHVVSTPA